MSKSEPEASLQTFRRVLEGRLGMNVRNAEIHPDPAVRKEAEIRVSCYRLALSDLAYACEVKS